jgi:site-specific DNA-methyltransferase (adenine-specific)
LARKPLSEKTIADNVLKHGTGGINIDGCRINCKDGFHILWMCDEEMIKDHIEKSGRFPANLILDEFSSDEMDKQSGILKTGAMKKPYTYTNNGYSLGKPTGSTKSIHEASEGGASRFFYVAKASKKERNAGLEDFEDKLLAGTNQAIAELKRGNTDFKSESENASGYSRVQKVKNNHPTVKPIKLMQYLVRLITPPNGICLDPYNGSGSTGCACMKEGFNYIGIDNESEYIKISDARIEYYKNER